jgi:hypothetical protein
MYRFKVFQSQAYKLQWPLSVTEHLFICFGNLTAYCDHNYLYYTNLYQQSYPFVKLIIQN